MENDDIPVGQILSRRDALKLLGVSSAAFLAACAAPEETSTLVPTSVSTAGSSATSTALDCVVRPELTLGPYFVDEQLNRSDVRSEPSDGSVREGVPLTINILDVANSSCTPIEGARVDIWHCDALGVYSGVSDQVFTQEPYASKGDRDTRNTNDNIYSGGGDQLLLAVTGDNANGYAAAINIGLDLTDAEVGASVSSGGPGGGPPP